MSPDVRALDDLFASAPLGAPDQTVGFVMWRVVHRYLREVDRALASLDVTHLQFMTLAVAAWLGRSGEPVTQSQLSRSADIHPMQVSHMLKTLEAKGLVTRPRKPSDIRAKNVEITERAVEVLRQALPRVVDVQGQLFGPETSPLLMSLNRVEEG